MACRSDMFSVSLPGVEKSLDAANTSVRATCSAHFQRAASALVPTPDVFSAMPETGHYRNFARDAPGRRRECIVNGGVTLIKRRLQPKRPGKTHCQCIPFLAFTAQEGRL